MATGRTALQMYTAARQLADHDQPGTGPRHVGDAEARDRVNESVASFWDKMVELEAEELLRHQFDRTPGLLDAEIPVPTDFYKLLGVDLYDGATFLHELERVEFYRRNDWVNHGATQPRYYMLHAVSGGSTLGVTALSNSLQVFPTPDKLYTYRFHYVPEAPFFDEDTDLILLPNRWWQWIQVDSAIYFRDKSDEDTRKLLLRKAELQEALLKSMSSTDYGQTRKIKRTRHRRRRGIHHDDPTRYDW